MLIKKEILFQDIIKSDSDNRWRFGNEILYKMCRENPGHTKPDIIVGKILLIGRSYAAAIERRKNSSETDFGGDFYYDVVAPKMLEVGPELDRRIIELNRFDRIKKDNLKEIVETHLFLTNIFSEISGLNKRSLASKYLHFHSPNLFYIFDRRAIKGARDYVFPDKELRNWLSKFGDMEYVELVIRLFVFQEYVKNQYGLYITPRGIDSFLLNRYVMPNK